MPLEFYFHMIVIVVVAKKINHVCAEPFLIALPSREYLFS